MYGFITTFPCPRLVRLIIIISLPFIVQPIEFASSDRTTHHRGKYYTNIWKQAKEGTLEREGGWEIKEYEDRRKKVGKEKVVAKNKSVHIAGIVSFRERKLEVRAAWLRRRWTSVLAILCFGPTGQSCVVSRVVLAPAILGKRSHLSLARQSSMSVVCRPQTGDPFVLDINCQELQKGEAKAKKRDSFARTRIFYPPFAPPPSFFFFFSFCQSLFAFEEEMSVKTFHERARDKPAAAGFVCMGSSS